MVGSGEPVALQDRVMLEPSRVMTSELLSESSISGGTATRPIINTLSYLNVTKYNFMGVKFDLGSKLFF